ncbi:YOP s translocation K family protein, partial [Vibrio parahaemolyticus V-223/04]
SARADVVVTMAERLAKSVTRRDERRRS